MRIFLTPILLFLLSCGFCNAQIVINEFLTSNNHGILDEDMEYSDWIELYNCSNEAVDITGYSISDDLTSTTKWVFPAMQIAAHGHVLVFASGKNRKVLPLRLKTVIDLGEVWKYYIPQSDIGATWLSSDFDDAAWIESKSGFGYSDNDDSTKINDTVDCLFIRKKFNVNRIADIGRMILSVDYDDGFVAYLNGTEISRANIGSQPIVSFNQFALENHEAKMYTGGSPEHFEISNFSSLLTEGDNLLALQVHNNIKNSSDLSLIPFLSLGYYSQGSDSVSERLAFSEAKGLHTHFKLDKDADSIFLFDNAGRLIDSVTYKAMYGDVSYSRLTDGSELWNYCGNPTPATSNIAGCSVPVFADSVIFSPVGGKQTTNIKVTLSAKNASDSIYFTTDGSIPDTSDTRYSSPISVSGSTVIKARVFTRNRLAGPIGCQTYITTLKHNLPVVCISTDPQNLWSDTYGIYAFGSAPRTEYPYFEANFWKDWERPAHFEYYSASGNKELDQEVGIKIFGAWSRAADQKSLAVFAR